VGRIIYRAEVEATTVEEVLFQLSDGTDPTPENIQAQAKATFMEGVNGHVIEITSLQITDEEDPRDSKEED